MDMEELTKTQLILLALLVSFVTSIATSIATASLLEQAPPKVTRVINRVVERTVEQVTPVENNVIEREETVVVREEDLITESIEKTSQSLVRVYEGAEAERRLVSLGYISTTNDRIVASGQALSDGVTYTAVLSDGSQAKVEAHIGDAVPSIALLPITASDIEIPETLVTADSDSIRLGQTVLAVSGGADTAVATGIVSRVERDSADVNENTGLTRVLNIHTNISSEALLPGTPLINLFGEVVGISVDSNTSVFVPSRLISQAQASGAVQN